MIASAPAPLQIHVADSLWADPVLTSVIAVFAVSLLVVTVWLLRRPKRRGRGAAAICLLLSVGLHLLLIFFVPQLRQRGSGARPTDGGEASGDTELIHASLDPDAELGPTAAEADSQAIAPLPLRVLPAAATLNRTLVESPEAETQQPESPVAAAAPPTRAYDLPQSLGEPASQPVPSLDEMLSEWLSAEPDTPVPQQTPSEVRPDEEAVEAMATTVAAGSPPASNPAESAGQEAVTSIANVAHVPGSVASDFANRFSDAKRLSLYQTGGDDATEAAVEAALRFLAADQRPDGSWDPITSGAGRETKTLGTDRGGAGRNATTGLTGLALLSMLGAGNTHQTGPHADNVLRGLSYLIMNQKPDGSLAGKADVYEANYCHGMAALAMCEAAAITRDPSAIASATAAVNYTIRIQHPTTGGWRYVAGDPGDLSQLGWQAMVLDSGRAAGIPIAEQPFRLTGRFLTTVRGGASGGLASYRPGDGPSRTMTAEALATRLLLGERIPAEEIREAEEYLLRQPPGIGRDNYYAWYYTSLALHQLQDEAWQTWNAAMKRHLLARQEANGSWPTDSEWGGYGGRVYTTAMASLCLEVYYRHQRRGQASGE